MPRLSEWGTRGPARSCCVSPILHLFLQPQLLVLFAPKALVVVAFALEKLLEVWLAVEFPMESCIAAQAEREEEAHIGVG